MFSLNFIPVSSIYVMIMSKQVYVFDEEFVCRLENDLKIIRQGLERINAVPPQEFLTASEFMARVKISRWKFDMLVNQGLLSYKKIGRKFYVPAGEVSRYFSGEMQLSDNS
jgi:hypothetical protein